jgi:hypothetical protein
MIRLQPQLIGRIYALKGDQRIRPLADRRSVQVADGSVQYEAEREAGEHRSDRHYTHEVSVLLTHFEPLPGARRRVSTRNSQSFPAER